MYYIEEREHEERCGSTSMAVVTDSVVWPKRRIQISNPSYHLYRNFLSPPRPFRVDVVETTLNEIPRARGVARNFFFSRPTINLLLLDGNMESS